MGRKVRLGCRWFAIGFVVALLCLEAVVLLGASAVLEYVMTIF